LTEKVCEDSAQLLDFQILHIEHLSEFGKTVDNLFDLRFGQFLEAIRDLVLDGRRSVPSKRSARFRQFNSNDAAIRRIPKPGHEPFLLQPIDDSRYSARLYHDVPCNLRGRQGTVIIESKETMELRGAYLIGFVQFFGVELSCLHEPADLIDDFPNLVLR